MKSPVSLLLLCIITLLLEGCGVDQQLNFKPVAKLGQDKYQNEKKFYRSGVLEKLDHPKGYFWVLKTKV